MGLAMFEWSRDWNCNILISPRIQFPHIRYHRFSPKHQPLVTVGVRYKSVWHVLYPCKKSLSAAKCSQLRRHHPIQRRLMLAAHYVGKQECCFYYLSLSEATESQLSSERTQWSCCIWNELQREMTCKTITHRMQLLHTEDKSTLSMSERPHQHK